MKLFKRLTISCLILILYSRLGTADGSETFSRYKDTLKFNHLAIHEDFGTVFVGAVNRLYKLSPNLTLLDNVTTTLEPHGINYNKILVINYREELLIACGNTTEYMCQTYRSINSEGKLKATDKIKVDGMAESGSNVSVIALIDNDDWRANRDGISKLYVAFSYRGYPVQSSALTIRKFKASGMLELYGEGNLFTSAAFNTYHRDAYKVNYIYGFNSSQYNYFLTTQLQSTKHSSPYISKVIRICFDGQSLWRGYVEIPIQCKFDDGDTFNLIQSANVVKPNSYLAKSLNISTTEDVLYAVFSKSRDKEGPSNQPSDRSTLCIYSLKAIDEKFIENIQNCFNGIGYRGFGNLGSNPKCETTNEHINSTFCSSPVNMPLIGNHSITASPVITFNTQLTAIVTKPSAYYNEVFVGTKTGHLKKVVVKDVDSVCEHADLPIEEGKPINADLLFSSDNSHLYVMTEHRLTRIKTPADYVDCSKYEGFNTCENAPMFCGWCALINKCTTRCDCSYRNYYSWKLKNIEEHARITGNTSYEFQIDAAKEFLFPINISFAPNTKFNCEYTIGNISLTAFGFIRPNKSNIICPAPSLENSFRDIAVHGNYVNSTLLISTLGNEKIANISITFFDCGTYNSSKACIFSKFKCDWRSDKNKCVHNATIIHIKTEPIESTSQRISIPSGVRSVLKFPNVSLSDCDETFNYNCMIGIEKINYMKEAQIINCSSIFCKDTLFIYDKNSSYTIANVTIMRTNSTLREVLFQTNFVIYKCPLISQHCKGCLNANAEYECGWCLSSKTCEFKKNCSGQMVESSKACPRSPPSNITNVSPLKGPYGGGTNVTIVGDRLGYKFEDISQNITVAGIACTPFREKYKEMKSITCAIEKFTKDIPEGHEGPVEVIIYGERIKSPKNFKFLVPKIENINPKRGFTRGGTLLTISDKDLDAGSSAIVLIGSECCKIISHNSSNIQCITKPSSTATEAEIRVIFDNNLYDVTGEPFTYIKDPKHDENGYNIDFLGIPAGGVEMLIRNVTVSPSEQLLFHAYGEKQIYNSSCKIISGSNSTWSCLSPNISDIKSDSIDVNHPIQMNVSFTRNLTKGETLVKLNNQPQKFFLYPNPEFHYFHDSSVEINEDKFVIIEGKYIDEACQKTDIIVKVGNYTCEVISLSSNQVVCKLSEYSLLHEMDESQLEHDFLEKFDTISVSIGANFTAVVKKQQSSRNTSPEHPLKNRLILYAVIVIMIIIVLIAVIYFFISKRKLSAKTKKLKKTQQQMTRLELRVASECKEAFVELQTQATNFMVDDSYTHLPFYSYHTYTMNILFPNNDDHSFILDGKTIPIHKEKGLILFRELIMDINFIITFVRTLEKEESFTINDRVLVASMIMITLQKDMKYCTDILQILLAELIEKYSLGNSHPKLLFRKTESIVEKMLSAWFSFLLYKFLTEYAGPPLFNLFTAIKEHVNRGPVDMVTSQARYCLSENKLLRQKFEFSSMTIYVNIPLQTAEIIELEMPIEGVPVQVLDCDTISQFKEKALDAIYHSINYSRNLHSTELIVEWVYDKFSKMILSDEDSSSVTDGEWRQKNTLRHYGVPDGSIFNLISDKEANYCTSYVMSSFKNNESKNTIKRKTSTLSFRKTQKRNLTGSTSAPIQGNVSRYREWHLIKPHDAPDGQEDHSGIDQMMPEVYLPRLLATKSSLQKFVDEMFDVIFNISNQMGCFPIAIKHMFDFLDDLALHYNITDPDVIHVWKNNCLPLRFWVNLIKNPNFLFDVHKSNIVDSCLSVIAQVFMDSCSSSEQIFNKDSATTKLLYAKEIPIYNAMVQKYYADIKSMPKILSHDVNAMLLEESKKYTAYSYTNEAVDELFKYAFKYKDNLIDSLKKGGSYEHNVLVLKLEKTITMMSG